MKKSVFISQLTQQTEAHLQLAISQWQMMPHSSFARMPDTASWSANHCLQHLNSYGRYYLPLLQQALTQASLEPAGKDFTPGWLGAWFTNMMKPDANTGKPAKKMKAPAPHQPATILPSHQVIGEFIDQQEQLLHLLNLATTKNLSHPRIPISIARFIKLKAGDVLGFLIAHNERHVQQAIRALAQAAATSEKVPA